MANPTGSAGPGTRWAQWLREQLAGRPQKWITDRSDGRIGSPRISAWLKGQRPDAEGVVLVADILGASRNEALLVAGYDTLAGLHPEPPPRADPDEERINALPISEGAKEILRERRAANIAELERLMDMLVKAERRNARNS